MRQVTQGGLCAAWGDHRRRYLTLAQPPPLLPPDLRACQILLAASHNAVQIKKRGFQTRVDDVAGNIWQALPGPSPGISISPSACCGPTSMAKLPPSVRRACTTCSRMKLSASTPSAIFLDASSGPSPRDSCGNRRAGAGNGACWCGSTRFREL